MMTNWPRKWHIRYNLFALIIWGIVLRISYSAGDTFEMVLSIALFIAHGMALTFFIRSKE